MRQPRERNRVIRGGVLTGWDSVREMLLSIVIMAIARGCRVRDLIMKRVSRIDIESVPEAAIMKHWIPSGRHRLDAVLATPINSPVRATVFICHGIGETVENWLPVQRMLASRGVASLVFDYAGYGRSTGFFSSSRAENDAIAAFDWLRQVAPTAPIWLLGFSLGSGIAASVVADAGSVFVVTEGGYAKRTGVDQYRPQQRGGLGIKVAKLNDERGVLAGALIVEDDDEVLVVLASGKVVRSAVAEVPAKGRDTMGVVFARFDDDDRIIAVAKNSERNLDAAEVEDAAADGPDPDAAATDAIAADVEATDGEDDTE